MKYIKIKFKILNKPWTLRLMTRKEFKRKHGAQFLAVTQVHKRRIDAKPSGFDEETLVHELFHAFTSELCVHSTTLDHDNYEEFAAELVSKRGKEMLKLGKLLSKKAYQKTS